MGTKENPGTFDCYEKAEPDEPMFVLLARDPNAPNAVRSWAVNKLMGGSKNYEKMTEAFICADTMDVWRQQMLKDIHETSEDPS